MKQKVDIYLKLPTLHESNLSFTFPDSWLVIKSDAHRFYRYLSGSGLKLYDFMAMDDEQLLLIEVKNYEDRFPQDEVKPADAILNDPELYAQQFVQKFEDSFQLIRVVEKHYQRQFWYKYSAHLIFLLPKFWLRRMDWYFWNQAFQRLENQPQKVALWLWLEIGDQTQTAQKKGLEQQLAQYFTLHFAHTHYHIQIKNQQNASSGKVSVNSLS